MQGAFFYFFASVALLAAIGVVVQQKVFYAAISLIVCLCAISGIYLILDAQFIAAVQVIVYAGAIMVLFLFVIMLLDPFSKARLADKKRYLLYFGGLLGIMALALLLPLLESANLPETGSGAAAAGLGTTKRLGHAMFREYLLPFEVTSVLILAAIAGAVVLAKRKL